jgi:hypothetical protein
LFEAGADRGLAARFDHPGADEEVLTAEPGYRIRSALRSN